MKVHVWPSALQDIADITGFHDEVEPGLGWIVYEFLDQQIDHLTRTGGLHRKVGKYHRCFTRGSFDYFSIYYLVSGDDVFVDVVLDQRRDPQTNEDRLRYGR